MVDWDKIVKSHVVKTFRNICNNWWGIDIQFYDANGNCKNNNTPLNNPLCNLINYNAKGAKHCFRCCKKNLKGLYKSNGPFVFECHIGLNVAAIPILVYGNYIGAMLGSGIRSSKTKVPQKKKDLLKLTEIGLVKKSIIEHCYNKLNLLNAHSEAYLVDIMGQIAGDVASFCEMLLERDEMSKRQAVHLETVYNKKYSEIVGTSRAMKKVFDSLEKIENFQDPVLIEGETGTGKELLAAAIHYNSPRKEKMFIDLNCSVFSQTLLSSELFGHVKGAFTGAASDKKGMFEIADGGTLFLDEIGEMDIEVQASLLRALGNGTFYKVGGTEQKKVDVRIIAATNKELKKQVEKGLFRKDLYYRINTIQVNLPPLRERSEDIIHLANHFLSTLVEVYNTEQKCISQDVIEQLLAHHWPGNVRELENQIKRMIIISGNNNTITLEHVPAEILSATSVLRCTAERKKGQKLRDALREVEKEMILKELETMNWDKEAVVRELGISRTTLNDKIAQYKIQKQSKVN